MTITLMIIGCAISDADSTSSDICEKVYSDQIYTDYLQIKHRNIDFFRNMGKQRHAEMFAFMKTHDLDNVTDVCVLVSYPVLQTKEAEDFKEYFKNHCRMMTLRGELKSKYGVSADEWLKCVTADIMNNTSVKR